MSHFLILAKVSDWICVGRPDGSTGVHMFVLQGHRNAATSTYSSGEAAALRLACVYAK